MHIKCGVMRRNKTTVNPYDKIGKKYGRLLIIEFLYKKPNQNKAGYKYYYLCQCDCGETTIAERYSIGKTKNSCGCLHKEQIIQRNKQSAKYNGDSNQYTRLFSIWSKIKYRCLNTKSSNYSNYGGRGITICQEWLYWENFKTWALTHGYSDLLSIDRIDVNDDYKPTNCRWVDDITQANNKRNNKYITINNETKTLAEWCRIYDVSYDRTKARINDLKISPEKALFDMKYYQTYTYGDGVYKKNRSIYITYNGVTLSTKEWQNRLGIRNDSDVLSNRARKGWNARQIIETPIRKSSRGRNSYIKDEENGNTKRKM